MENTSINSIEVEKEKVAPNERTNALVKALLSDENSVLKCEAFIETLNKEIEEDDDTYSHKGRHALRAIAENNVDDFIMAISGWSFESILKMAFLLRDDTGKFYPTPLDAEFVSVWDGGVECRTRCKVNLQTFEVYNIETTDMPDEILNNLDEEYIEIDENRFPVSRIESSEEPNATDFWYK